MSKVRNTLINLWCSPGASGGLWRFPTAEGSAEAIPLPDVSSLSLRSRSPNQQLPGDLVYLAVMACGEGACCGLPVDINFVSISRASPDAFLTGFVPRVSPSELSSISRSAAINIAS